MDSTIKINRTMRESADIIDALCQSSATGNLVTIDRQAIRLWTLDKQIKAVHFTEEEYHPDVLGLEHLHQIDGYVSYLQSRQSSLNLYSLFKVWSSSLHVLFQVRF
jgi:hypothetical protein